MYYIVIYRQRGLIENFDYVVEHSSDDYSEARKAFEQDYGMDFIGIIPMSSVLKEFVSKTV